MHCVHMTSGLVVHVFPWQRFRKILSLLYVNSFGNLRNVNLPGTYSCWLFCFNTCDPSLVEKISWSTLVQSTAFICQIYMFIDSDIIRIHHFVCIYIVGNWSKIPFFVFCFYSKELHIYWFLTCGIFQVLTLVSIQTVYMYFLWENGRVLNLIWQRIPIFTLSCLLFRELMINVNMKTDNPSAKILLLE